MLPARQDSGMERRTAEPIAQMGIIVPAVAVSAIGPKGYGTWLLEVAPILIVLPILVLTHRKFPLTSLARWLIVGHALVLALGAHYTYAEVPIGFRVRDLFDLQRNPYERFAHVVRGFVPAIVVRELLLRRTPLRPGRWTFALVTMSCLGISAAYELLEWAGAVIGGENATDFLGTQGDVWDTQWDMLLALLGAMGAQWVLGRAHDRRLSRMPPTKLSVP
jgi:putative membrane protein